jgi:hypothetical protein
MYMSISYDVKWLDVRQRTNEKKEQNSKNTVLSNAHIIGYDPRLVRKYHACM